MSKPSDQAADQPLDQEELGRYRKDGYLLFRRQLFSEPELSRLDAIFQEHRAAEPGKEADEFDTPHFEDERLLDYLLAPQVLDLVGCVLGPDIILWSSHFICKEPKIGRATPWHEDSAYWSGKLGQYDKIVTVWLALDDVDRGNGCMQVIPGSHLAGGFSEYESVEASANTFHAEIRDVDTSESASFVLRRGECSLHDGRIVHGAEANTSERRRLGYTMRYLSAETRVTSERIPGHRLWLARGRAVVPNKLVNA